MHSISRGHHQTTMTLSISIRQSKSQVWISKFMRDGVGIAPSRNQNWPWQAFLLLRTSHECKTQPCCYHFQSHLKHNHDDLMLTRFPMGRKAPTTANSPCWETAWEVLEQQQKGGAESGAQQAQSPASELLLSSGTPAGSVTSRVTMAPCCNAGNTDTKPCGNEKQREGLPLHKTRGFFLIGLFPLWNLSNIIITSV